MVGSVEALRPTLIKSPLRKHRRVKGSRFRFVISLYEEREPYTLINVAMAFCMPGKANAECSKICNEEWILYWETDGEIR